MLESVDPAHMKSSQAEIQKKDKSVLQEEHFHRFVAEVEDYSIILLDTSGKVVSWNKGAEKIKLYAADEILGRHFMIFYPKEDRDAQAPERLLQIARNEGKANQEGWRIRKDGTRFWGSISITAIHDDEGNVNGFLKLTRDLTERKKADDTYSNYVEQLKIRNEELRKSEEQYHKMFSEVSDYVIILLGKDGKVLDWNKGAERIKGYKADEIVGKSFRLFYTKEDKESGLPDKLLAHATEHGSIVHEGWRIRKDGTRFWGSVTLTALHNNTGEIFGFSKVTRDLTERKIADERLNNYADDLVFRNEELRRSEERYHRMISEVKDYAIILLDPTGKILNWNAGAELIKGYKSEEIVGKSFELFYPSKDRENGVPQFLLNKAAVEGKAIHEGWRIRKDGTKFWGTIVITALHDRNNDIIGYSKVTRDLTAKKAADDLLINTSVEIERKNKSLEKLNEEISSFTYVASHDLKEPLRKIQTFASRIIVYPELPERILDFANKINSSAARMQKLMEDLLAYSQMANHKGVLEEVDLNQILHNILVDLELLIAEKNAKIISTNLPIIKSIAFQISQVFLNLISNSLKFSKVNVTPVIEISHSIVQGQDMPGGIYQDYTKYLKYLLWIMESALIRNKPARFLMSSLDYTARQNLEAQVLDWQL